MRHTPSTLCSKRSTPTCLPERSLLLVRAQRLTRLSPLPAGKRIS
jgi:hypothetical protein